MSDIQEATKANGGYPYDSKDGNSFLGEMMNNKIFKGLFMALIICATIMIILKIADSRKNIKIMEDLAITLKKKIEDGTLEKDLEEEARLEEKAKRKAEAKKKAEEIKKNKEKAKKE